MADFIVAQHNATCNTPLLFLPPAPPGLLPGDLPLTHFKQ